MDVTAALSALSAVEPALTYSDEELALLTYNEALDDLTDDDFDRWRPLAAARVFAGGPSRDEWQTMTNDQRDAWWFANIDILEGAAEEPEETWLAERETPTETAERHTARAKAQAEYEAKQAEYEVAKAAARPARATTRGPRGAKGPPRLDWRYAPMPRAILEDRGLPPVAKVVAGIIAASINLAPWNHDLHVDLSYPELAERAGVSRSAAIRAVAALKKPREYLEVASLNRGGCRFRFGPACR